MSDKPNDKDKAAVTLSGTVERIILQLLPTRRRKRKSPWKARNTFIKKSAWRILQDESGNEVALKKGAKVDVTIEADPEATEPKK
jgi:hypothetical protein